MSITRKKFDKQLSMIESEVDSETRPIKFSDPSLSSSSAVLIPASEPVLNMAASNSATNIDIHYNNTESFAGEPLSSYPGESLFITNDRQFCFVIDELVKILIEKNRLYNPYTNQPFSPEDSQRLMKLPQIQNQREITRIAQQYNASKISQQTIKMLKELAENLMNKQEILRHEWDAVPIAQNAYEKFTIYYQALDSEERESLNNYWIDSWDEVYIFMFGPGVRGMQATTFGSLYQEFNDSCIHSIGGSIAQLVLQLAPNTEFNASCIMANRIFESIKNNNDFESSQYVTATVERGILRRIISKIAAHPILASSILGVGLGIGLTFLFSSTLCILLIPVFPIFFIALKESISHYIINPIKRYFYPETDSLLNPSNDEADNNDQSPMPQNNSVTITCAPEEKIPEESPSYLTKVLELLPPPEAKIAHENTIDAASHIESMSAAEEKNSRSCDSYPLISFFGRSRSKQSFSTKLNDNQPSTSKAYGSMN